MGVEQPYGPAPQRGPQPRGPWDVRGDCAARATRPGPAALVIEEDETLRSLLEEALREGGVDPIIAPDAATAVELARELRPDLLVLDARRWTLGLALAAACRRAADGPTPVLWLADDLTDAAVPRRLEAVEPLEKPFDIDALLARVDRAARAARN